MANTKWNTRNKYEWMSGLLDKLGGTFDHSEVKDEFVWRAKILDQLGQTYVTEDIKRFDLWRQKVLDGLSNYSGGGGGGSSDFSTAEVTLNITIPNREVASCALVGVRFSYPSDDFGYEIAYFPAENNKCNIVLYNGYAEIQGLLAYDAEEIEFTSIESVETSGGVSYDNVGHYFTVTGNGTITAVVGSGGAI